MPDINLQQWTATGTTLLSAGDEIITNIASLINGNIDSAWTDEFTESTTEVYTRPSGNTGPHNYPRLRKVFSRTFHGETWYLEMYNEIKEIKGMVNAVDLVTPEKLSTQFLIWRMGSTLTAGALTNAGPHRLMPLCWSGLAAGSDDPSNLNLLTVGSYAVGGGLTDLAQNKIYANETANSLLISISTLNSSVNVLSEFEKPIVYFNNQFLFIGQTSENYTGLNPFAFKTSSSLDSINYNNMIDLYSFPTSFYSSGARAVDLEILDFNRDATPLINFTKDNLQYVGSGNGDGGSWVVGFVGAADSISPAYRIAGTSVEGILTMPFLSTTDLNNLGMSSRPQDKEFLKTSDISKVILLKVTGTSIGAFADYVNSPDITDLDDVAYSLFGGFSQAHVWGFGPYNV